MLQPASVSWACCNQQLGEHVEVWWQLASLLAPSFLIPWLARRKQARLQGESCGLTVCAHDHPGGLALRIRKTQASRSAGVNWSCSERLSGKTKAAQARSIIPVAVEDESRRRLADEELVHRVSARKQRRMYVLTHLCPRMRFSRKNSSFYVKRCGNVCSSRI